MSVLPLPLLNPRREQVTKVNSAVSRSHTGYRCNTLAISLA